ncbi:MAG: DEAD/DEAH box helicase [Candidatus Cloacimonetes bacterium]|nr:DEAD/DEAH box helicase [Candidatus Cloacimonadota bacterium]
MVLPFCCKVSFVITTQESKASQSAEFSLSEHFLENGIMQVSSSLRPHFSFLRDHEEVVFQILGKYELLGSYRKGSSFILSLELRSLCLSLKLKPGQKIWIKRSVHSHRIFDVSFPHEEATVDSVMRATVRARAIPQLELQSPAILPLNSVSDWMKRWDLSGGMSISEAQLTRFLDVYVEEKNLKKKGLIGLEDVQGIDYYPHQVEAVRKAIFDCHGRVLLADEVGLGKTIEAGLIIHEYAKRREVQRILIVTPASLTRQWQSELKLKFDLDFELALGSEALEQEPRVIVSLDTVKLRRYQGYFAQNTYDLVIVDEAHKLKNRKTLNYQFVKKISSKFLLLLTATPIQNELLELYNLIHLLAPGALGTLQQFRKRHVHPVNRRLPVQPEELKKMIEPHMIRNTRRSTSLNLPPRRVIMQEVVFGEPERLLYDQLESLIHDFYFMLSSERQGMNQLTMMLFQKLMTSSPQALLESVSGVLGRNDLGFEIRDSLLKLETYAKEVSMPAKLRVVLELLENELKGERVLIFTQFRRTQTVISEALKSKGITVHLFYGEMSSKQKEAVVKQFKDGVSVLVSTDAGSEGQNLQFARYMINYDLPWNPMKVEQRIGRVHRLGQKHEVFILNLFVKDTIEEHIVHLLQRKIKLFERIVGELEMILGYMGNELSDMDSLDRKIMEIVARYREHREQMQHIDQLGEEFVKASSQYSKSIMAQEQLFEDGPND